MVNQYSQVLGVIPARYASTRLPGKPLVDILGKPMIQWVYEAAKRALPHIVVATDDDRIFKKVKEFGGEVVMTPKSCPSGSDRMWEAAKKIKKSFYVNIQGDEPLLDKKTIVQTVKLSMKMKSISTASAPLRMEDWPNGNAVKVQSDKLGRAQYFFRRPGQISESDAVNKKTRKHLGLYVYPRAELEKFVQYAPPLIESREKLEQLRALYHGMPIYVSPTDYEAVGVDTESDLIRVRQILRKNLKKWS